MRRGRISGDSRRVDFVSSRKVIVTLPRRERALSLIRVSGLARNHLICAALIYDHSAGIVSGHLWEKCMYVRKEAFTSGKWNSHAAFTIARKYLCNFHSLHRVSYCSRGCMPTLRTCLSRINGTKPRSAVKCLSYCVPAVAFKIYRRIVTHGIIPYGKGIGIRVSWQCAKNSSVIWREKSIRSKYFSSALDLFLSYRARRNATFNFSLSLCQTYLLPLIKSNISLKCIKNDYKEIFKRDTVE